MGIAPFLVIPDDPFSPILTIFRISVNNAAIFLPFMEVKTVEFGENIC